MTSRKRRKQQPPEASEPQDPSESGVPGGGKGRTDLVGGSGVYPASASQRPSPDAPVRSPAEWGQGDRGAAGASDTGPSELFFTGVEKEEVAKAKEGRARKGRGPRNASAENRGTSGGEREGREGT